MEVASDLRFRAVISEPQTPSFFRISGNLALSTRKSLAIAIVRFWCAKIRRFRTGVGGRGLATDRAPNAAKIVPQNCVHLLLRGE